MKPMLGILGGMGPLATVDFMHKVIDATPVETDQDHIPMLVASLPQIPDRTAAILKGGESPLPALLEGIATLNAAGVGIIAIPCNSAHYWYDEMAAASAAPILHIADAACDEVVALAGTGATVGLMGTSGTMAAGMYQDRLARHDFICLQPDPDEQERLVMGGIYEVKAGRLEAARKLLEAATDTLRARGAQAIVLGCTEIPIVLAGGDGIVDATAALARACVRHFTASD